MFEFDRDWHLESAEVLEAGRVQTGLMVNNQLDMIVFLPSDVAQWFFKGLGLDSDLTAFLQYRFLSNVENRAKLSV